MSWYRLSQRIEMSLCGLPLGVYHVLWSCSYPAATSIVFVKWLELIRTQMIALGLLKAWFVRVSWKLELSVIELKRFISPTPDCLYHSMLYFSCFLELKLGQFSYWTARQAEKSSISFKTCRSSLSILF